MNLRDFAFRAFHGLRPDDDLLDRMRDADAFQWSSLEEQARWQSDRLVALLEEARGHVDHYREIPASDLCPFEIDASGVVRWTGVPILDKGMIRARPATFLNDREGMKPVANATSGSTGESLRFFLDGATRATRNAATHRFHGWAGVAPTDRQAKLWGARFDAPHAGIRQRLTDFLHPTLYLSSYRMSASEMAEYARRLMDYRPALLTSYPSPLEHFARYWRDRGYHCPSLRAIVCSAEQMRPDQRALFEEVFGCPVFDRYGSREFGNVAQECASHDGLHVATDRVVLEIVDAAGDPVAPGEVGEVLVTDLDNYVMPFIRYRTGDLASWATGRCGCGRDLPRVARLEGRVMELISIPGGATISGTFWPQIVKQASPRVRLYQVAQVAPSAIRISLVMEPPGELAPEESARLHGRIAEHAPGLAVEIRYVEDIPLTPGGKRRTVLGLGSADDPPTGSGTS